MAAYVVPQSVAPNRLKPNIGDLAALSPRGANKVTFSNEVTIIYICGKVHRQGLSDGAAPCSESMLRGAVPEYASFFVPQGRLLCETQLKVNETTFSELSHAAARMKAEILHLDLNDDTGNAVQWPVVMVSSVKYIFDQVGEHSDLYYYNFIGWRFDDLYRISDARAALSANEPPNASPTTLASNKVAIGIERPTVIYGDGESSTRAQSLLRARKNEADIPVCGPAAVSKHPNRVFIVDSGTTTNVMCEKIAQNTLRDFVRNTRFRLEFDTANSSVTTSKGLRAQIGTWDKAADYVLMKDSPELISVGNV